MAITKNPRDKNLLSAKALAYIENPGQDRWTDAGIGLQL